LEQQHGFDSIPKLKDYWVKDFDNLLLDALNEISNISRYSTFTELPNDVNNPNRRQECEALKGAHDYTRNIDFFEESSFKQQCLSGTISILTI